MKRILCTGDSHTWGQGADGLTASFDPPVCNGDLRLASFGPGSYVNRLRRMVEQTTGSFSREWSASKLAEISGAAYEAPCARITSETLALQFEGALLRIEIAGGEGFKFELKIDGEKTDFGSDKDRQNNSLSYERAYRIINIHLSDSGHTMTLKATEGTVSIYRVEAYSGRFAVINSGIGSCPSYRFRDEYFEDYVANVKPDIVLAEAHTINDWIVGDSPKTYGDRLEKLLKKFQTLGGETALMTVSPILCEQSLDGGADYSEYVDVSREVAERLGIPLCDANRIMRTCISGMSEDEASAWMFSDRWHPNERGHAIYAELLYEFLHQKKYLKKEKV